MNGFGLDAWFSRIYGRHMKSDSYEKSRAFSLLDSPHFMKFAIAFISLSFLLTACSRSDAKLKKQIVGTWQEKSAEKIVVGQMVFGSNSSFSFATADKGQIYSFSGTWQINDGIMTMTTTNLSPPGWHGGRVGETGQFVIAQIVNTISRLC